MTEAGIDYTIDCLPDPAVLEQMLNMSPIKYVTQVFLVVAQLVFFISKKSLSCHFSFQGTNTCITHNRRR